MSVLVYPGIMYPAYWLKDLGALCALLLVVACATSADPIEISRKSKSPVTAAVANKAPMPADGGVPDRTATSATVPADEKPRLGIVAAAAPAPAREPFGDVGFKEVSEKEWVAGIREKIAQQQKVDPAEVRLSPGRLRAAFVRSPVVVPPTKPGRRLPPRRHQIIVVDNQGQRVGAFRPITAAHSDEPPKDLQFLTEDRLVYEVVAPAPVTALAAPSKASNAIPSNARPGKPKGRMPAGHARAAATTRSNRQPPHPAPQPRLFVIQPIAPGARPIRCLGLHFAFTREHDRLTFVGGAADAAFVAVDGAQVYPRRGRTIVSSAPVWSKDGRSLAFLESRRAGPARLVLLAEFDNPTGDTTWDLPPATPVDSTQVFWAGSGKLVVGKNAMHPVFSTSFVKEASMKETPRDR